jgi:hypothetical protein
MISKWLVSLFYSTGLPIHCGPLIRSTLTIHNALKQTSATCKNDIVGVTLQQLRLNRDPFCAVFSRAGDLNSVGKYGGCALQKK